MELRPPQLWGVAISRGALVAVAVAQRLQLLAPLVERLGAPLFSLLVCCMDMVPFVPCGPAAFTAGALYGSYVGEPSSNPRELHDWILKRLQGGRAVLSRHVWWPCSTAAPPAAGDRNPGFEKPPRNLTHGGAAQASRRRRRGSRCVSNCFELFRIVSIVSNSNSRGGAAGGGGGRVLRRALRAGALSQGGAGGGAQDAGAGGAQAPPRGE